MCMQETKIALLECKEKKKKKSTSHVFILILKVCSSSSQFREEISIVRHMLNEYMRILKINPLSRVCVSEFQIQKRVNKKKILIIKNRKRQKTLDSFVHGFESSPLVFTFQISLLNRKKTNEKENKKNWRQSSGIITRTRMLNDSFHSSLYSF